MSISTIYSAAIRGIDGLIVTVEATSVSSPNPKLNIIGLPDTAIRESEGRVRSAARACNLPLKKGALTVNLAPADIKKEGTVYDLPILLSLLEMPGLNRIDFTECCFLGELSLSGELRPVRGVLPMAVAARDAGFKKLFVPRDNACEASAAYGITVYPVKSATELIDHLMSRKSIEPMIFDKDDFFSITAGTILDFSDVKGQEQAKSALEIAAAGEHNILMIGPPGTGKSMLASRVPYILPPITLEESIETSKIYSIAGLNGELTPLLAHRPFRSPHHSLSPAALIGGGTNPRPGEISLANNGVLFLDEFPEFDKHSCEVLRQPIEDRTVTITRVNASVNYPCSFMMICAMNPCKCGYYGHPTIPCSCTPLSRKNYLSMISGPILDRIDIQVEVNALEFSELDTTTPSESSDKIRRRVTRARNFAMRRFDGEKLPDGKPLTCNARMEPKHVRKFCIVDEAGRKVLNDAYNSLGLSARGYDRILKVARTIADFDESEIIKKEHVARAVQLRSLDRKYFNH
ncbi:MAG: YifB family Mg chelatase-like AAA ATPase [Clostridia bacterium]|nr:YifB family Mg chelatase-like AAA ATPase [Clostridia bacterium]MBO5915230.1 YifB family Mg chelatase-like AAA ATPase [Clostridia bacterium]